MALDPDHKFLYVSENQQILRLDYSTFLQTHLPIATPLSSSTANQTSPTLISADNTTLNVTQALSTLEEGSLVALPIQADGTMANITTLALDS
jgi:hypothetical protein